MPVESTSTFKFTCDRDGTVSEQVSGDLPPPGWNKLTVQETPAEGSVVEPPPGMTAIPPGYPPPMRTVILCPECNEALKTYLTPSDGG